MVSLITSAYILASIILNFVKATCTGTTVAATTPASSAISLPEFGSQTHEVIVSQFITIADTTSCSLLNCQVYSATDSVTCDSSTAGSFFIVSSQVSFGPVSISALTYAHNTGTYMIGQGVTIWNDRSYTWNCDPALEGKLIVVLGKHKNYANGIVFSIMATEQTNLYVIHHDIRTGGFDTTLGPAGFT